MQVVKTRLDAKGRISIPYHMRASLGLDMASELRMTADSNEIVLTPSASGVRVKIRFPDISSLLKTIKLVSEHKVNIGNETITNLDKRKIEWSAVLEGEPEQLKSLLKKIKKYRAASGYR